MREFLGQFCKRMELVAVVDSIVNRRNTSTNLEQIFQQEELDNILFSILVFIMEMTLTEDSDCTMSAIEDFLREILPAYHKVMTAPDVESLARYLVKDILQNKGERREYRIMDYEHGPKQLTIRLITDRINEHNEVVYSLTQQGYNFLFRTKEVDEELGFQLEEMRLKMLIHKKNYKRALEQSRELLRMLNEKRSEMQQFELQLRGNLNELSGADYEEMVLSVDQMLDDEYRVMQEINDMVELSKINSSTNIRMSGSQTPQSTLHIGVPQSLDGQYEERMRNYVSQRISTARELLSTGEFTNEKMRRYLEERFSDRQLLNTVIGQTNIPIKLYKVESIPQNSRLKAWENIVVENSGGELFVSCFILISALMSYSRRRKLALQNAAEGSKVFLIDNPFGKASSPHLLEAMIRVAKKFETKLLCLPDLSQSSITQQFDLIYQLSMRKATYSSRSYLKTDEVKNNADLHVDGRLEHISAYWEQMSLL